MGNDSTLVLAAVRQLPGVTAAEVDHDGDDRLVEVRVQLAAGADWAEVEPAVLRLVRAGDPSASHVRVVPMVRPPSSGLPRPTPPDLLRPPPQRTARPQIRRIDLSTVGPTVTATVELAAGGMSATGTCSSVVAGSGLPRAVATATLRALEGLLVDAGHLELEHVLVSGALDVGLAVVRLSLVSADGAQLLAGAALVRHDQSDAVVRAVLDASNRRVEALLQAGTAGD